MVPHRVTVLESPSDVTISDFVLMNNKRIFFTTDAGNVSGFWKYGLVKSEPRVKFNSHELLIYRIATDYQGNFVCVGRENVTFTLKRLNTPIQIIQPSGTHQYGGVSVAFAADSSSLAVQVASYGGGGVLWGKWDDEKESYRTLTCFPGGHHHTFIGCGVSNFGTPRCFVGAEDAVYIYTNQADFEQFNLQRKAFVFSVARDGSLAIIGYECGMFELFSLRDGGFDCVYGYELCSSSIVHVAWHHSSNFAAITTGKGKVFIINTSYNTRPVLRIISGPKCNALRTTFGDGNSTSDLAILHRDAKTIFVHHLSDIVSGAECSSFSYNPIGTGGYIRKVEAPKPKKNPQKRSRSRLQTGKSRSSNSKRRSKKDKEVIVSNGKGRFKKLENEDIMYQRFSSEGEWKNIKRCLAFTHDTDKENCYFIDSGNVLYWWTKDSGLRNQYHIQKIVDLYNVKILGFLLLVRTLQDDSYVFDLEVTRLICKITPHEARMANDHTLLMNDNILVISRDGIYPIIKFIKSNARVDVRVSEYDVNTYALHKYALFHNHRDWGTHCLVEYDKEVYNVKYDNFPEFIIDKVGDTIENKQEIKKMMNLRSQMFSVIKAYDDGQRQLKALKEEQNRELKRLENRVNMLDMHIQEKSLPRASRDVLDSVITMCGDAVIAINSTFYKNIHEIDDLMPVLLGEVFTYGCDFSKFAQQTSALLAFKTRVEFTLRELGASNAEELTQVFRFLLTKMCGGDPSLTPLIEPMEFKLGQKAELCNDAWAFYKVIKAIDSRMISLFAELFNTLVLLLGDLDVFANNLTILERSVVEQLESRIGHSNSCKVFDQNIFRETKKSLSTYRKTSRRFINAFSGTATASFLNEYVISPLEELWLRTQQIDNRISIGITLDEVIHSIGMSTNELPMVPNIMSSALYMNGLLMTSDADITHSTEESHVRAVIVDRHTLSKKQRETKILAVLREMAVLRTRSRMYEELKGLVFIVDTDDLSIRFVCFEYAPRDATLEQVMNRGNLSLTRRIELAHSLVYCVFSLHKAGFTWANASPENVLVFGDTVRISGFDSALHSSDTRPIKQTGQLLAPECVRGERPSHASDIYAVGYCLLRIFSASVIVYGDPVESALLVEGAPYDIIKRCVSDEIHYRPSINELVGWSEEAANIDTTGASRINLIRSGINAFYVSVQRAVRERNGHSTMELSTVCYEQECGESFRSLFVRIFDSCSSFFLKEVPKFVFGIDVKLLNVDHHMQFPAFFDYISGNWHLISFLFKNNFTAFNDMITDEEIRAYACFIMCCLLYQKSIPDTYLPRILFVALSSSYNQLSDREVFKYVWPDVYISIGNIFNHGTLDFFLLGLPARPVTRDNIEEFVDAMAVQHSSAFVHLATVLHETFYSFSLLRDINVVFTRSEVKTLVSAIPTFSTDDIMRHLDFSGVPNTVTESFQLAVSDMGTTERLKLVFWMTNSYSLTHFTVILQPDRLMLPSIAMCDRTLRLPDFPEEMAERIHLALSGIMPKEFERMIYEKFCKYTQEDVDAINMRLRKAKKESCSYDNCYVLSIRMCPTCYSEIYRDGGCKMMTCSCGTNFCIRCARVNCGHGTNCNLAPPQKLTLEMINTRLDSLNM
ncbi:hypothetical protein PCE1_004726 [Barthelona sp. PCE]